MVAKSTCLVGGWVREECVHDVEVGVDHERRPRPQVDVLLPPVGHVVVGPQPLEPQISSYKSNQSINQMNQSQKNR